MLTTLTY